MRMSGKNGWAVLLVVFGSIILLSKLGFVFHWLAGLVIPMAMAALGYYAIKRGRSFIGWVLLVIGTLALLSKLSGLIAVLIAAGFIVYGVNLLRNRNPMEAEV